MAEHSLQFRGQHPALCGRNRERVSERLSAYLPLDAGPKAYIPHDPLNRSRRQAE